MKILALETSTDACSVALWQENKPVAELFTIAPRKQTELILPMVEQLLAEQNVTPQQLTGLAVGVGPGAFTGVRIAVSVAQGLAYGLNLPVVAVSSLAALAKNAINEGAASPIVVAQDARMNEIYWAIYENVNDSLHAVQVDQLVSHTALPEVPTSVLAAVGTAIDVYTDITAALPADLWVEQKYPNAASVVELALTSFRQNHTIAAEQLEPQYLRNQVTS